MNRSLTVLLPVHNAQATLERDVAEILDVACELTAQFELAIVDDGSTDATWELAQDLARRYPQVKLLRHSNRQGTATAIRTAVKQAAGQVVIAHEGGRSVDATEIARLWRTDRPAAPAAALAFGGGVIPRPFIGRQAAATTIRQSKGVGFQLLRSGTIAELRRSVDAERSLRQQIPLTTELKQPKPAALDRPSPGARRPNFLTRVKMHVRDFTVGE